MAEVKGLKEELVKKIFETTMQSDVKISPPSKWLFFLCMCSVYAPGAKPVLLASELIRLFIQGLLSQRLSAINSDHFLSTFLRLS